MGWAERANARALAQKPQEEHHLRLAAVRDRVLAEEKEAKLRKRNRRTLILAFIALILGVLCATWLTSHLRADTWPTVILAGNPDSNPIPFGDNFRCVFVRPRSAFGDWLLVDRQLEDVWVVQRSKTERATWIYFLYQGEGGVYKIKSSAMTPESLCGKIR